MKILVVDDNQTNLKLVSDLMEFEGYEIWKAEDAEKALKRMEEQLPDLVLLDIALPGMDGISLMRKLKAEERTKNLCIVALTAFAMKGDEKKALEAGFDGYITKPIDTRSLPRVVESYLAERKAGPVRQGMRVLIIEDAPSEMKLARQVLSIEGHSVVSAGFAEEALQRVNEQMPEIILLDLHLPTMDGLSLARKLKSDPATRGIPIVAITSHPEKFPREEVLAAGCDAWLVKPLNTRRIATQLEALVKDLQPKPEHGGL